jgi:hypothetical protein
MVFEMFFHHALETSQMTLVGSKYCPCPCERGEKKWGQLAGGTGVLKGAGGRGVASPYFTSRSTVSR